MPAPLPPDTPTALDVAKVRDVLGNQVLEILRLQSEVDALQAQIVALTAQLAQGQEKTE